MAVIKQHGIYFLTGSLRSGKGLTAVSKIKEHLLDGRKLATNMDLKLENMLPANSKKVNVLRLPDHPVVEDLEAIGLGYDHDDLEHYDESKFGLLVLDELATFLNSRNWNDKKRKGFIDWLLMSGKKRWILMLTIQDLDLLDNQIKKALASQYIVDCKSLSKYAIPFLSPLFKFFTGRPLTLPKSYLGVVKVGTSDRAPVNDRWFHLGTDLYSCYNTAQVYLERDHPKATMLCSMLSPWHIKGRYLPKKDKEYYAQIIRNNIELLFYAFIFTSFISVSSLAYSFYEPRTVYLTQNIDNDFLRRLEAKIDSQKQVKRIDASNVHSPSDFDCSDFKEKYQDSYIAVSFKERDFYRFTFIGSHGSYSDYELFDQDVVVKPLNRCHVVLTYYDCSIVLNCNKPFARTSAHAVGVGASKRLVDTLTDSL